MGMPFGGQAAEDEWEVEKRRILDQMNREAAIVEEMLEPESLEDQ